MAHFHAFVTLSTVTDDCIEDVRVATAPQREAGLFDWIDRVVAETTPEEAARCVESGERVCIVMSGGKSWSTDSWDQQHHASGPLPHPDALVAGALGEVEKVAGEQPRAAPWLAVATGLLARG